MNNMPHKPACFAPWQEMLIAASGNVVPCAYYTGYGNEFGTICGDAKTQTLHDIWNGQGYRKIRRFLLSEEGKNGCPGCLAAKQGLVGHPFKPGPVVLERSQEIAGIPYEQTAAWANLELMLAETKRGEDVLTCVPANISFTPSHRCNFNCRMCYQSMAKNMVLDSTASVFQEILDWTPQMLQLNLGGGEPFLNELFNQFIDEFVVSTNPILSLAATTNGSLVNETVRERLQKFPCVRLTFSLDGTSRKVFEFIRRNARFEQVMHNLRECLKVRDELGADRFHVGGNMAVMRSNIHQLPDMISMMADLRMGINLQPVNCYPADECINAFNQPHEDMRRFRDYIDKADALYDRIPELQESGLAAFRAHLFALETLIPFELLDVPHFRIKDHIARKFHRYLKCMYGRDCDLVALFFPATDGTMQTFRYWAPIDRRNGNFRVAVAEGEYLIQVVPRNTGYGNSRVKWHVRISPSDESGTGTLETVVLPKVNLSLLLRAYFNRKIPERLRTFLKKHMQNEV
jgi:MoaA/NifB/PqqE/SkfB family radical SAM enzyme